MPIHILPDHVVSQIAAGEVVERPSSVVKELIENAIDAKANHIILKVEGSGQRLIEVSDNGIGIPATEVPLALMRHATSKLDRTEDLFQINTLGFRGEALASIGSVSRLTLTSFTGMTDMGVCMKIEGGKAEVPIPLATTEGTTVRVEDLFFNVPARLKFLKSAFTEHRHISGLVTRYALAYPSIRWEYLHDGKIELQTSGNNERREILAALYGLQDAKKMLDLEFQSEDIHINGYISPISLTRSNRREITIFVNGRWIQDVSLTAAIIKAYHTMLMVGRYPLAVLFIQVPPDLVDVNVHPAKAEVRFQDPDHVFSEVQRAIRRGLLAYSPVPTLSTSTLWGSQTQIIDPAWNMAAEIQTEDLPESHSQPVSEHIQPSLPGDKLPLLRLIGQVASTYLIAEGPDGLYLIDQHAAHERILFEKLMTQFKMHAIPSQTLLEPSVVQLSAEKSNLLNEQLPYLEKLGFVIEIFGPNAYKVRAIPALILGGNPSQALMALVESFEEDESPLQSEIEARIAGRVCKRMAVKGGQVLSGDEQKKLLFDLEACQSPRTCPHGRPTMIHLSADLLERQFGRTGAR